MLPAAVPWGVGGLAKRQMPGTAASACPASELRCCAVGTREPPVSFQARIHVKMDWVENT